MSERKGEAMLSQGAMDILKVLVEENETYITAKKIAQLIHISERSVNTYLKEVVSRIAQDFDFVVIDGEAGIEQINRRVMEKVTHLILVSDLSKKGIQVIQTIKKVADEMVMYEKVGVILNRVTDPDMLQYAQLGELPLLGWIPEDRELIGFDIRGESLCGLSSGSNILVGVENALKEIGIFN